MSDGSRTLEHPRTSEPEHSEGVPQISPSPSPSPSNDLERHGDVWFDDGNIVLVAGNTAFRVYRGLLAAQSTVFSDMFEASSPVDGETFEGCPVIRLFDSTQDLVHLLKILVPKEHMSVGRRNPPLSPDGLFAVIRLAHKYGIESVEREGLETLQAQYKSRLNSWIYESPFDHFPHVHAIGAINLARLTDTSTILPVAMLRCVQLGDSITEGWKREDGSVEHLSAEDHKRVVDGRDALFRRGSQAIHGLSYCVDDCDRESCEESRSIAEESFYLNSVDGSLNIFKSYQDVVCHFLAEPWCRNCEESIEACSNEEQRSMWDDLPEMFDL